MYPEVERDHRAETMEDEDSVKESSVESFLEEDPVSSCSFSSSSSEFVQDAPASSSSVFVQDASSSSSSSTLILSHANRGGPLYELSELMAQIAIKRGGLSKFYKGKSQSYTSLARVKSIEDLAKKVNPHNNSSCNNNIRCYKMKPCKSYAGLDAHKSFSPKTAISKKASRGSTLVFFN